MSRDINQSWRYAKSLAAEGDMEGAEEAAADAAGRKFVNKRVRALGTVNKLIRQVEDDPTMSGLQKRQELNRLYEIRNKAAEETVKAVKAETGR